VSPFTSPFTFLRLLYCDIVIQAFREKGGLRAVLAFDKSTHPVSPSAGECDYIKAGVFTQPRPEAAIRRGQIEHEMRVTVALAISDPAESVLFVKGGQFWKPRNKPNRFPINRCKGSRNDT
jgi:hypothetical protein